MEVFLTALKAVIDSLGATVVLPVFIFLFAVIMGAKPGKAFRAGVTIGVAFIGINLVIGLMWGTLSDASNAMVTNWGITRDVVDVGWPSAAAIAFGSDVGLWIIPVSFLVNFALLGLKVTDTLNIDIWNFWHFAFIGSIVYMVTDSMLYGILASAVASAFALFLADWTAKAIQPFYNLPGISITTLSSSHTVPFAMVTNWIIDRIPGVRDWEVNSETIQKKFGVFGEPIVLGLVIGLALGIMGFYNAENATVKILQTGMNLAAVMLLLPRMAKILMEGLLPISEAARDFMNKRSSDREIHIGLDSAIIIGHESTMSASFILVPIAILLSIILPGNRVLLFADLAAIPFFIVMFGPLMKGNIFRMIVGGTLFLIAGFYMATAMGPLFTAAAQNAGFAMPEGAAMITAMGDGFMWPPFVFAKLSEWLGVGSILIFGGLTAVAWFFYKKNPKVWETAIGAPSED